MKPITKRSAGFFQRVRNYLNYKPQHTRPAKQFKGPTTNLKLYNQPHYCSWKPGVLPDIRVPAWLIADKTVGNLIDPTTPWTTALRRLFIKTHPSQPSSNQPEELLKYEIERLLHAELLGVAELVNESAQKALETFDLLISQTQDKHESLSWQLKAINLSWYIYGASSATISRADQAIQQNPDSVSAYEVRGDMAVENENYADAWLYYQTSLFIEDSRDLRIKKGAVEKKLNPEQINQLKQKAFMQSNKVKAIKSYQDLEDFLQGRTAYSMKYIFVINPSGTPELRLFPNNDRAVHSQMLFHGERLIMAGILSRKLDRDNRGQVILTFDDSTGSLGSKLPDDKDERSQAFDQVKTFVESLIPDQDNINVVTSSVHGYFNN